MTFKEIQNIIKEKFGATRSADIARELGVTPQVVSNWKARNQVPYKYVKILRNKINKINVPDESSQSYKGIVYEDNLHENKRDKFEIVNIISKFYKLIISNILIFFIIPIMFFSGSYIYIKFIKEYIFISQATILPISDNSGMSGLQSLAQQFGVSMSSNKGSKSLTSSIMFPEILKSRMLAKEVLNRKFNTIKYGDSLKLINIIMDNPEKKKWLEIEKTVAINIVRNFYEVKVNRNSPLLSLSILTFEPQFSADLGNALIEVLKLIVDDINLSQIKEKKVFIEARIKEVNNDLINAEEALKDFRMRNRNIKSSPSLLLEQERLIRNEEVKTQVFINLKNQFEINRIEEVGGGSMFQVLDYPEAAPKPIGVKPKDLYFASIIFGFFISLIFIIGLDWFRHNKKDILSQL